MFSKGILKWSIDIYLLGSRVDTKRILSETGRGLPPPVGANAGSLWQEDLKVAGAEWPL